MVSADRIVGGITVMVSSLGLQYRPKQETMSVCIAAYCVTLLVCLAVDSPNSKAAVSRHVVFVILACLSGIGTSMASSHCLSARHHQWMGHFCLGALSGIALGIYLMGMYTADPYGLVGHSGVKRAMAFLGLSVPMSAVMVLAPGRFHAVGSALASSLGIVMGVDCWWKTGYVELVGAVCDVGGVIYGPMGRGAVWMQAVALLLALVLGMCQRYWAVMNFRNTWLHKR